MQHLTEEQIQDSQELFFTILENFIEDHYTVSEDHEMTEEDAYVVSILMDHFMESYRHPTLQESTIEIISGRDINEALYDELADILLDESVGKFVAGAAHGIRNFLSKVRANRATSSKEKAKAGYEKHLAPGSKKTKADVASKEHEKTDYGSGAKGSFKQAFAQSKVDVMKRRADKAKERMRAKETERKSATAKHQSNLAKSDALAKKIDTGVQNIKKKVKDKIASGAAKVGSVIGKAAGAVAR